MCKQGFIFMKDKTKTQYLSDLYAMNFAAASLPYVVYDTSFLLFLG